MKYCLSVFLFLLLAVATAAQPLQLSQISGSPKVNTYAVVIGISSYLDTDVTPLEFSNRDAVVFADFLMSASGGAVPKKNIKLLVDSAATSGEVDKALRWLKDNAKKDDVVYFYFSGHGALENVTMFNNGYLICYNTPAVAFVNMGLSIDYLNDIANTLSVQTNAHVVMITDACHSGKMAGSKFKGNYLVGEQLMAAKQNEIRMASCTPDQLSNEKADWGGGRGVFSYHLVNGLQGGLADADHNAMVTLGELKNYMQSAMANDLVLKNDNEVQTPVIKGDNDFKLSTVVQAEAVKIKQQVATDSLTNMRVLVSLNREDAAEPEAYFLSIIKEQNLEELTDSLQLYNLPAEEITFALIKKLKAGVIGEKLNKLDELENILKSDKEKRNRFNVDLARAFTDRGQEVILHYLKGDEAEMERRRYYNISKNGYDIYSKMFGVAFKLSQSDKYIRNIAAVLMHYFSGVALRLKVPLTAKPQILIEQALAQQKKALTLEEHAAYIYNELGILYQFKKDYGNAELNYIKATELSPRWALPHSNLCGLYGVTKKFEKAVAACHIADSLQSGLQSISVNLGFINEEMGNQLYAEEYYRNAIDINSRHYIPFERLGNVYMNTTNYAMADSFFYEADLRKKGYHFGGNEWDRTPASFVMAPFSTLVCKVDPSILKPTDIFAFFTWGVQEYGAGKFDIAVKILKKVIANDKTNPLVFHYLGKIFYDQQKWEEAEVMFKLALKYSKNKPDFEGYVDSVIASAIYPYDHECFENFFKQKYYDQVEDYYFAGTMYESWKHVEEAEIFFKKIIDTWPSDWGGYTKLWRLYEKQGRYTETAEVIKKFGVVDSDQAERELNAFYRRTIEKFPDNGDWNYKLGLLLYSRAKVTARVPYFDSIVYFPLLNKELFIDLDMYEKLGSNDILSLADKSTTGAPLRIHLDENGLYEGRYKNYKIQGTKEFISLADPIYMPRKDGIHYLQRASELISEKETLADIHFKTGNIFLWAGSKKQAYPFFEKSLELVAENANARFTLVDIYAALYKNKAAMKQLNYLYDSSQINFEKRLLLAQFNIHAGQFETANNLLDKAEAIHPYTVPEIEDLRGRLNLLKNKPKEAIEFYYRSLAACEMYPGDEVKTFTGSTLYTISRLYAKTGKNKEALKWLQSAIDFGFNYSYVLHIDPFMNNLRKTQKWKAMVAGISIRSYKSNFSPN